MTLLEGGCFLGRYVFWWSVAVGFMGFVQQGNEWFYVGRDGM
jgi:hypothetical protein